MTHPIRFSLCLASLVLLLSACATPVRHEPNKESNDARAKFETAVKDAAKANSHFHELDGPSISIRPLDVEKQAAAARAWLSGITITLDPAKETAISAPALIRALRAKGLNITASLPVDDYNYSGFGVTNVSAETALLVFFGAMGLDYNIDDAHRIVTIQPSKSRTWVINLGNRSTSYTNGSASTATTTPTSTTPTTGTTLGTTAGATSSSTAAATTPAAGANTVSSKDSFWENLEKELKSRLTILIPKKPLPSSMTTPTVPTLDSLAKAGSNPNMALLLAKRELYEQQLVGLYSINPDTGAITVQAPRYIADDIDKYLTSVQDMYNTAITFEGELVSVTNTTSDNVGVDWTAFATFAARAGTIVLQNNLLGGVVLSAVTGGNSVVTLGTPNAVPASNTTAGIMSKDGKFALFNAYLSSIGLLRIHERPLVATTSGVPVNFGKTTVAYYQTYNQTVAAGTTGSSSTATNTVDVPYTTGIRLRINPRIDVKTGLVRAQISIWRSLVSSWDTKVNVITVGSTIQNLSSRTPQLSTIDNDGEVLLKDGDIIVLGGLTEDKLDETDAGISGLRDSAVSALTGSNKRSGTTSTYYFALRVTINKKS